MGAFLLTAGAIGLLALLGGKRNGGTTGTGGNGKDDPAGNVPSGQGTTTKKEPPQSPEQPKRSVIPADQTGVVDAPTQVALRTPMEMLDPEGAGVFIFKRLASGAEVGTVVAEIVGKGWAAEEPRREYIVEVKVPGTYRVQMMEKPSLDDVFIADWTIKAE